MMAGIKYWYVMYYIIYHYFNLDTNSKFASAGNRTRVVCVTGGHSLTRLFWAQMALVSLVPFQGPKKSRFSGPTPSNAPSKDVEPLKTMKYKCHKNNWYIGILMYPSAVV